MRQPGSTVFTSIMWRMFPILPERKVPPIIIITIIIVTIIIIAVTIGTIFVVNNIAGKETTADGSKKKAKTVTETNTDQYAEPETLQQDKDDENADENAFVFRDVFGVEYETVINPSIPAKIYPDESFKKNGDAIVYLDGEYSLGIDVSHHQGYIDFNAVKNAGYDFVIARIGYRGYSEEGSLNADREFENYYTNARAAGLKAGAYFFAQAVNEEEAKEEADFVLSILNGRKMDLPIVYDPESILDDVARTDNVSGEQFTANTKVFCETITEGGYDPMIYANMLWEAFKLDLTQLKEYPIWYADYEDKPQTPYDFVIWQYTNEGNVPGVEGVCDIDIRINR